ncbi:MAG: CADD family putative folate metabolism protein [Thermoanaerobaculia bacterium]|nr:CADD family putative folate metabolism protein [Thermoanaerobaculia bacterium]
MSLIDSIDRSVSSRRMLDHSFYTRWSCGELTLEELRLYAKEYFHYTMAFPTFLSAAHAQSNDLAVRQEILENLIEEERGPGNHPELWLRFCEALGLSRQEVLSSTPSASTQQLIDTMKSEAHAGTHRGLAALYSYESQIPAVAKAKIEGLAEFYEIDDPRAISFFTVHMTADVEHADTARRMLTQICDDDTKVGEAENAATKTLDALYGFLSGVEEQARAA